MLPGIHWMPDSSMVKRLTRLRSFLHGGGVEEPVQGEDAGGQRGPEFRPTFPHRQPQIRAQGVPAPRDEHAVDREHVGGFDHRIPVELGMDHGNARMRAEHGLQAEDIG